MALLMVLAISSYPFFDATLFAVFPLASLAVGSAPFSSRNSTISSWPPAAAAWSGVDPFQIHSFQARPRLHEHLHHLLAPLATRQVWQCGAPI